MQCKVEKEIEDKKTCSRGRKNVKKIYVKYFDAEIESITPFSGANNNSQIFCENLS